MSYLDDLDEEELAAVENIGTLYLDELCGYRKRSTDPEWGKRQRQALHEEREAQAEVAWDLGVSLPTGHPFAPVVDDRAAA